jgi:hypothetical protein
MPILLFINDFGIHQNMYQPLKAFYITPANLTYQEHHQIANTFTLTLRPHGAEMDNIIHSLHADFQDLEKGITMDFNGEKKLVNVFLMAITGDMP